MLKFLLFKMVLYFNMGIIYYSIFIAAVYMLQLVVCIASMPGYIKKVKRLNLNHYKESENMIPISVLVPAYNEETTIIKSIYSMLSLNYPIYEIIVANDGSKDSTLETLIKEFSLEKVAYTLSPKIETKQVLEVYQNPKYPQLKLIDKVNGGKADALNVGINFSKYPYIVCVDADSLIDPDSLVRIAMAFMEYKYTIAVGGIVRVANGSEFQDGRVKRLKLSKSHVVRFQLVEYIRAFLVGRVGWDVINAIPIISGAYGAFQKKAVLAVGGYSTGTVGEDMDLVLKLHGLMRENKYKYAIKFLPDPICWTQVPESLKDLYGQRKRWQAGLLESLSNNKRMFLNPKYGALGMVALPFYFLVELIGPIVEVIGIFMVPLSFLFGILSLQLFIMFFTATVIFGVIFSMGAFLLEEYTFNKYESIKDFFTLSFYAVIENMSYRQMTAFFRLMAILRYRKNKQKWGEIERKHFT